MIFVGIDVAKDKHDSCILGPDTEELFQIFTIRNNSDGYGELFHETLVSLKGQISDKNRTRGYRSLFLVLLSCSFSLPVLGNQLLLLSDAVDWFSLLPRDGFCKAPTTASLPKC